MDIRYSSYPLQYICYDSDDNLIRDHPISLTIAIAKHLFLRSLHSVPIHSSYQPKSASFSFIVLILNNSCQLQSTVHCSRCLPFLYVLPFPYFRSRLEARPAYISRYSLSCTLPCTWFIHSSSLPFPFLRPLRALRAWYWWRCLILILMLSLNSGLCKHISNQSQPSVHEIFTTHRQKLIILVYLEPLEWGE